MTSLHIVDISSSQKKIHRILDGVINILDKSAVPKTPRNTLSGALYSLSQDHSVSVIHLIKKQQYSSAFALYRPSYEALLRGAWTSYAATDKQIELLTNDKEKFPNNKEMHTAFNDKAPNEFVKIIQALHMVNNINIRNDFTHGGLFQLSLKITQDHQLYNETVPIIIDSCLFILAAIALGFTHLEGDKESYEKCVDDIEGLISCIIS